ncbi:MAG: universal stress protein [Dehalococcoidia bacterium]|nr:universal stress protein [Dehalococcoidia bacterium]
MYQHIVVALDGSPLAEAVLPYVTAIAGPLGSELHLVQVVREARDLVNLGFMDPTAMGGGSVPDMKTIEAAVAAQVQAAERYLQGKATELRPKGLKLHTAVLMGEPSAQIVKYAQDRDADLIAISTHGRGGLSRMFLGSVADKVMRQGTVPVLLIRAHEGHA